MTPSPLDNWLLYTTLALVPLALLSTLFVNAPYGRHSRKGWGPTLSSRVGWVLMESPSALLFPTVLAMSPRADRWTVWLIATLWIAHYTERTLIYPVRQRGQAGKRIPIVVVTTGFLFNMLNSTVNGRSLGYFGPDYDASWLSRPAFWLGVALFLGGFYVNRWADGALRGLRPAGQSGYRIPHGGLYEYVSCPNYFGELVQWTGWAIATWSLAGVAFAAFTAANLVPRALAHHRWYRTQFPNYPPQRKAIIPALL